MNFTYNMQKKGIELLLDKMLKYIDKDPQGNLVKMSYKIEPIFNKVFPPENFKKFQDAAKDPDNIWTQYALSLIRDIDRGVFKQMLVSFGVDAGLYGTKAVRENREKYKCNIPFIILFDPTSACNLKCKGCWAAEYGHKHNLSNEEMQSIVSQGKELGTHFYMLTGGEPLVRKKDVVELAKNNKDCVFVIYTNATLVDQKFCDDMKEPGTFPWPSALRAVKKPTTGAGARALTKLQWTL